MLIELYSFHKMTLIERMVEMEEAFQPIKSLYLEGRITLGPAMSTAPRHKFLYLAVRIQESCWALVFLQHSNQELYFMQMDTEKEAIAQRPKTSPGVAVKSTNMCYIIFTSGSTGRPKGTVLQHAGVVNYFLSLVE